MYKYHEDELIYQRAWTKQRRDTLRAMADGELAHGCVDCGEKDLQVLDFDHVRGVKTKHVSRLIYRAVSFQALYAEIDKCEVRCANCHRRVTARRLA
jgi:hypothetical protein